MTKRPFLSLLWIFILSFSVINLYAGNTGKIAGKVIDAETGEPLIGINIIIEGTSMGAASAVDGTFIINNIPPGTYTIIASGVGLQKKRIENVKVSADFTTRLDFELASEDILVETVVVRAETPLIRQDLTSSHTVVDATQIETLPVESISGILRLQAGITQGTGGELHIRGGRTNEISYSVNGVSVVNPFDNTNTVSIATNAIQELSVVSGTFNAEYGNALSGVVNTITKEGGEKYSGNISFYTGDYVSSRDEVFFNVDDFDALNNYIVEGTFSGPVPLLNKYVSFFASARFDDSKGWLYGIREHSITDSIKRNPMDPNDIVVAMTGDSSIIAMNPSKSISTTGKLTFKPIPTLKINYDFLYSAGESQGYSHDLKYNTDANPTGYSWSMLNAIDIRHAISNTTFYELKGSINFDDYKRYLFPLLDENGNEVDFYAGMSLDGLHPDPRHQPSYKYSAPANYTFITGGSSNSHYYQRSRTIAGKFDITSQITNNHEVKLGLFGRYHKLNYESFTVMRDTVRYFTPTVLAVTSPYRNSYVKYPIEVSAYVQDKMEFDKLILNVGLRYDYFWADSRYLPDNYYFENPNVSLFSPIDKSWYNRSEPKHQISPRLGVSFPITDRGIIHFSYGHFYQMPPFTYLYANPLFKASLASGFPTFGNANLNPERTVTYELGLQQQLSDDLAFNVTGFYKDVRDLLATQTIRISGDETYYKYVNKDYANIKGVTFSMTKRRTQSSNFGFTLDYTFQVAEGNDTDPNAFFIDISSGRQPEKLPVYLTWDQSHTLNGTFSVGEPSDWNVTLVGRIGTGLPYTPQLTDNLVYLRVNSDRRPSQMTVDLMADKTFVISNYKIRFFLKVYNLFDTLNERLIYTDTGRSTYTLQSKYGSAEETDRLAERVAGVHPTSDYFNVPSYYGAPRNVKLGLSFEF
ncbi:MAG: TonB-dependent receptor [Ignavibacteriales bacterium]|nr:TonB-dependent receptor [Ignavibacteriales bacterium]